GTTLESGQTFNCRPLSTKKGSKGGATLESRALAFYRTTAAFTAIIANALGASDRTVLEAAPASLVRSRVLADAKAPIYGRAWFDGDDTSIDGLVRVDFEAGIVRSVAGVSTE